MLIEIREYTDSPVVNISLDTVLNKKQALVFANSKSRSEKIAEDISKKINFVEYPIDEKSLLALSEKILSSLSKPTKQCLRLSSCVKRGIAFHHSGLHSMQRHLIEDAFRQGLIKIISSTPTLAAGLDLPAYRVVMADLKRFNERWGMQFIPVLEYHQMIGRAGRPGKEESGEAISIVSSETEKEAIYEKYVLGSPEEITSKLAVEPVFRTYLLSLISTDFVNTKQKIFDFFKNTFWAFQYDDMNKLEYIINKMLDLLVSYNFIIPSSSTDFNSANDLTEERYVATPLGRRVSLLYIDPLTANEFVKAVKRSEEKIVNFFSLLHLVSSALEMRPLLRVRQKEEEIIKERLAPNYDSLIVNEPNIYSYEYTSFLDSIKTALFFEEWINEKGEDYLLDTFNITPGELHVKIDRADWLLYSLSEISLILGKYELVEKIKLLRFRLKYGVKEELFELLALDNIGRVRARRLYMNNIRSVTDIKNCDVTLLSKVLGPTNAKNLKAQVGVFVKVEGSKKKTLSDY